MSTPLKSVHARNSGIAFAVLVVLLAEALPSFAAKPAPSSTAQATFVDYAQCANGAPPSTSPACPGGWLQGILQGGNSHYSEDQVTPQRAEVVVPAGSRATGRTLTFSYQARKATTHAYDSLATWNYTQTAADRCQGLAPADCVGGSPTTFPIPADPTLVGPAGAGKSLKTSDHQLPGQVFTMYGGTITAASTPTHDNAGGSGDDYATITITYSVPNTSVDRKVQFLFGGHIAASFGPRGWGAGFGAGNINGGPYHIKWTGADGASIGNRDNQLMGSAVIPPPSLTVTKTADKATVSSGENIGFTVTVKNTGEGSATNVTLSDPLPAGTGIDWSIDPAYPGPGTCSIAGTPPSETLNCAFGNLAAGASVSVHVQSATTSATSGTFNNTATAKADNNPPVTGTASVQVLKPSLSVAKVADKATVNSGENIGFTVTVTNGGPGVAKNVTLSDPLPGGTGIDWSIDGGTAASKCSITGTPSSETLNCTFGDLAAGDSVSVHVLSATTSATSGTFDNTATATSDNAPPFDDSASVQVLQPSLSVLKKADKATVSSGDNIGFTMTATNAGPGVAKNVTLSDPLPAGTGINWSIDGGTAASKCSITTAGTPPVQTLNCAFGDLAAGASASVHISSATSGDTTGEFKNTATAKADNAPPTTGTDTITVNKPSLGITKTADEATVSSGDDIGFTMTVSNAGPGTAKNVTLSDPLPGGRGTGLNWSIDGGTDASKCSITTAGSPPVQTLNCAFGDLAAGITVSVHVSSATTSNTSGKFDNTATAKADNAPPTTGTDTITVNHPKLSILKSADNATVDSGNPISFTITVNNGGTGTARNVTVDDHLPGTAGLNWSIDPAYNGQGTCAITGAPGAQAGGQKLHCDLGDVAGGTVLTIHVSSPTTAGVTCGPIRNTATIAAANTLAQPSSTDTITVNCAKLVVTKIACPTTVAPGGTLGYTISYSNAGNVVAKSAVLVDTVPAGTTVVDDGGGTVGTSGSTTTITWQLGDLAPGVSGTKTFNVNVPASADKTTLFNTVTLSSVSAPTASFTDGGTAVTNAGATAGGRAFGVSASILGGTLKQAPRPDTSVLNPDQVATVDVPPGPTPAVHAELVKVFNTPEESRVTAANAHDDALATTGNVVINVQGISITADAVVASAKSYADALSASSTRAGSTVKNLVIKDGTTTRTYETVTGPITVLVNNPTTGVSGKVLVLDTTATGAADGTKQPEAGIFKSAMTVNAIRVVLENNPLTPVDETTEVIVAHAESSATFPSGLPCGATIPQVRGDAYILDTPNIVPKVGPAVSKAVLVTLPVTGNFPGTNGEDGTLNTGDLSPLGTATSGTTHTDGTLSPLVADSSALVNGLILAGGAITATTVTATSTTAAGTSTGATTIEDLVIAGINVCSKLGTTCSPDKNTVLVLNTANSIVVLNEQLDQNGLRVNAIHIYVIGKENPFDRPAGAEIVISSAYSGTSS